MKKLKELELANDKALIDYWKSVMVVEECDEGLRLTREFAALCMARLERDRRQDVMAKARLEFLSAKVEAQGKEPRKP